MSEPLIDRPARDRFRTEWNRNFAVSANAGSGKTTSISQRLAEMALSPEGGPLLSRTAVVTFTRKAAAQIGQRARQVLLERLGTSGANDLKALEQLERTFFGTIHSFCLLLAQRYGQNLGINLNPRLVVEDDNEEDALWEEFIEEDTMKFSALTSAELDAFLRHVALEDIFPVARGLSAAMARELARRRPSGPLPVPSESVLERILSLESKRTGKARENLEQSKQAARVWQERFRRGEGFLPLYVPSGQAAALGELAEAWMAPLKTWLADAASVLAAELAGRYRTYRFERGIQTYADQIDAALAVLRDRKTLEKIRGDGWRVILDEAQDTDTQQFAVLAEITRPVGSALGTWPEGGGAAPRSGHFCMVGDGQQAIYGARADIRNFTRYLEAFERGDGGDLLVFQVTFRAPRRLIELFNAGFPAAFGPDRTHNLGLAPDETVVPKLLQVRYVPLEAAPGCEDGRAERLPLTVPPTPPNGVDGWLAEEACQLAVFLKEAGPAAVGAKQWGDVCVLAPRVDWLLAVRKEFDRAGLKASLQIRRNRNGDTPVYAWMTGLMAVICDPENQFEWFGVLREIFAVSDALLAEELQHKSAFLWETPEAHGEPLRSALSVLRPWILKVDDEGLPLGQFVSGLAADCALQDKAWAVDGQGGQARELTRLLGEAVRLGLEGAGPRRWLRELLAGLDRSQPSGGAQADAINLMTSHSAKGLEWPVVIPVGLWRSIGKPPERGLRLVSSSGAERRIQIYFDAASLPEDTRESRERERLRELVRLLYVTFTRAKRRLVIPWQAGFGGQRRSDPGFAELWGGQELIESLPAVAPSGLGEESQGRAGSFPAEPFAGQVAVVTLGRRKADLPRRVLPHELAHRSDVSRGLRHESMSETVLPTKVAEGDEAIDYGLWWHETMEFMPWEGSDTEIDRHLARALAMAITTGFEERGRNELALLRKGPAWDELRAARWTRSAELAVVAPVGTNEWIDGVIDLVMHDVHRRELCVVDWKTNRRLARESDSALLARVAREYTPQLTAYGQSMRKLFPEHHLRLLVYSSAVGAWADLLGH